MNRATYLLFWFSVTLAISLGLYHTSYRVDHLTHSLQSLNAHIKTEQRNIHILKAEWVFLSNPSRVASAAQKYLTLQPTKTKQISSLRKLSSRLPTQREALTQARKSARHARAYSALRYHPAASTPRAAAEESGRINRRLVIGKSTTHVLAPSTKYKFAGDSSYGIGSLGGSRSLGDSRNLGDSP